jgi:hypothetical protein
LKEAYSQGFLTGEDIENISHCHKQAYSYLYNDEPIKNPEALNPLREKIKNQIKNDFVYSWNYGNSDRITIDNVEFGDDYTRVIYPLGYYGTHKDCIALLVDKGGPMITSTYFVADVEFRAAPTASRIVVWKEGKFYYLREAYAQRWLTQEDIKTIAYYHEQNFYIYYPGEAIYNPYLGWYLYDPYGRTYPGTYGYFPAIFESQGLKQDYLSYIYGDYKTNKTTINDVYVKEYYDTYNGYDIIMMGLKNSDSSAPYIRSSIITIDGFDMEFFGVMAYNGYSSHDHYFYSLSELYERGILTQEDIINIANLMKEY